MATLNNKYEAVISGIGGKFPECYSVSEFQKKLFSKDVLLKSDARRWNPANFERPVTTGRLPDAENFDGNFFGVPRNLVNNAEPMLGLTLERGFEAMIDAGVNPFAMKGHNVSVISATSTSDAEPLRYTGVNYLEGVGMVGLARTMLANRLSFFFNFLGPSYNMNCSWTSAMDGLQKAATMVSDGTVEAALVISCNLIQYDAIDVEYRDLNLLSPDGKCSPFDAEANGFARSEGVVAFYVQRAQDAKRHYCSVVHAQSVFTGNKGHFLRITPQIDKFYKEFYNNCNINPSDIAYLETNVICKEIIDANILNSIANVHCTSEDSKLLIGSIVGNVGCSEPVSGFFSLVKVITAMETGLIPPTVNYQTPNPRVPALLNGQLQPVVEASPLNGDYVTVNCLNLAGNVSKVIVKRHGKAKTRVFCSIDTLPRLVTLQARDEEGIRETVNKVNSLPTDVEFVSLVNDVFKTTIPPYLWRGFTILPANESKVERNIQAFEPTKRPVWFIFSGMGSQWAGMGRDLMELPVFAAAIDKCDRVLRPRGIDVKHIITIDDENVFKNILNCFVGIAAVQIGLVDIMRILGVSPDGMIGHSAGELGCAYADGCLTAEEMVLAAYFRGKASLEANHEDIGGMMAAVGMGYNDIKDCLPESLDVACHNAADSCTLSGPEEDVLQYVGQLKQQGVFAKAVSAGGIAYHSRYIKSVTPKLRQYLKEVIPNPQPRSTKWICSSEPQSKWEREETRLCSAEYHTNNLLNPVLFEEACKYVPKNAIVIEIAPHGLLQAILKRGLSRDSTIISLATRFAQSNLNHLLNAVGQLYLHNVEVDVNALYPPVEYPVSRGTPGLADLVTWYHDENSCNWVSNCIAKLMRQGTLEKNIPIDDKCEEFKLWKEYCMGDRVVVPFVQLLIYAWKVWLGVTHNINENTCFVVENIAILDFIIVDGKDKAVNVTVLPVSFNFQVALCGSNIETTNLLTGKLSDYDPWHYEAVNDIQGDGNADVVTQEEVYRLFENFGIHLGLKFKCIKYISIKKTGCFASVRWGGNLVPFIDSLVKIIVFLKMDEEQALFLPSNIRKLVVNMDAISKLSDGAEVEVFYDKACDTLVCKGVQLCGLTLRSMARQPPNLVWRETKFQPYSEEITSVDGFLAAVLQLVATSELGSWKGGSSHINVLKIKNDAPILNLKNTDRLDISPFITVNHLEVDLTGAETLISSSGRKNYLVVGELSSIITLAEYVLENQPVYFLTDSSAQMLINDETIKPVMTCKSKYHKATLLKKIQHPTLSTLFEVTGSNWLSELRQVVKETEQTVVVYSRSIPARHLLPILAIERYAHRLRTVFICDETCPTFSAMPSVYSTILSLNLPINILRKGIWGFLTFVNEDVIPIESKFDILNDLPIWRNNNGVDVDSIGLNATHPSVQKENHFEIKYVDYSGYYNTRRIMGIAELDHKTKTLRVDPMLRWTVPDDWTMEEAASVPVIYALAYYSVLIKGRLKKNDFVLINDGLSLLSQAAISITLEHGGDIITSVKHEEEVKTLIELFPKLNTSQVMVLGVHDVNIFVRKLTRGKGVKLVINSLKNNDMLSSFRAMGFYCRFLHLGNVDVEIENGLGMNAFLRRTSFYGISVRSLFDCNCNDKNNIQENLQRGIDKGVVKPLRRAVFSVSQLVVALRTYENDHLKLKIVMTNKIKDNNMQHLSFSSGNKINDISLIAGTKGQLWLDVADWLVRRGDRRLIVLTEEDSSITESNLRIFNKLNRRYGAISTVHSMSQLQTLDSSKALIKHISGVGLIKSIFTIGLDEESVQLNNLDAASREVVPAVRQFVSLLGEGAAVSESRARSGLAVCHVRSSSALQQPALVLPYLAALLDHTDPVARFLTVSDRDSSTFTTSIVEFQDFLPSSVEELYKLSKNISDPPEFTEVATLSPGYCHLKENLLPIFVVSGLYSTRLDPFVKGLQYPAFCCKLSSYTVSVERLAEVLILEVLRVQNKGPYNIVGDSWGGAVALALGCLLEAKGHHVELFLIEGAPPTLRSRLKALCDQYNSDLGTSLLTNLLSLSPKVVENVSNCQRWEQKIALGLEHVSENIRNSVRKALTCLYSHLSAVQLNETPAQLFKGRATLFTCKQTCPANLAKLTQYCMQSPISMPTGAENHKSLLSDPQLLKVINENVRFDWRM